MIRILAADGMEAAAIHELNHRGFEVVEKHYEIQDLGAALKDFDIIVVRSATQLRKPVLDEAAAGGRLKLIIRGGVGIDNIDADYAEKLGITVRNTPCASSASVAELALGHMFSMARFIGIANFTMHNEEWNKKKYEGIEIGGKTLGLIGMGRIAQELAKRASALGMNILYTDILGENVNLPYRFATQEELLRKSDFVSLHTPGTEDQKPIIGQAELAMMKPTAFLLNTARGGLVDLDALCDALDCGALAGATLDVFPQEPPHDHRVLHNPKISMTPHIGAATKEAQHRIGDEIVDIICHTFD